MASDKLIKIFIVLCILSLIAFAMSYFKINIQKDINKKDPIISRITTINLLNGGGSADFIHIIYNNKECFLFVGTGRIGDMQMELQCLN